MDRYTGEAEKARTRSYAHKSYWLTTQTAHVQTALYGSTFDVETDTNWSLAPLQKKGDELHEANASIVNRLVKIAQAYDVRTLWAPNPTHFNGVITNKHALKEYLRLSDTVRLCRGAFADGIEIKPGEALILSSGGCPLVTIVKRQRVIAAHAGLKCLYDHDNPNRESVIDATMRHLNVIRFRSPDPIEVRIDFAIHPQVYEHPWDHPTWGSKNESLCRELMRRWGPGILHGDPRQGRIDLIALIRAQCRPYHNVVISDSCRHLGSQLPKEGESTRFYHTRMRPPYNNKRNLTLSARIQ
jgi:hypothetical protein